MSLALAAALAAAAVLALPGGRYRGPGLASRGATGRPPAWLVAARSVAARPLVAAAVVGLAGTVWSGPVAGVLAAAGMTAVARSRARAAGRRRDRELRAATAEAVLVVAAELRAGQPPASALARAASGSPRSVAAGLLDATRAVELGADPATALERHASALPGLRGLAGCWRLSGRTGARLAELAETVAEDLRAVARREEELAVAVAAPQATVRILAGLPVVGLVLGSAIGARPLEFLLHTGPGLLVLAAGLSLEAAGIWWSERLVERARSRS